jgi:hypothetical protein
LILRTDKPFYDHERIFKDRGGFSQTMGSCHLYLLKPEGRQPLLLMHHNCNHGICP